MPEAMTRRRRTFPLIVACVLSLSGVLLGSSAPAQAQAQEALATYRGTAAADGLRQTVIRPESVLVNEVVDAGTPSAQALVDGLGDSTAYGSFVYPGELLMSVPGLLSGPAGQTLPGYPLIALSSYPTAPKQDSSRGPLTMSAASTQTSSTGSSSFTPSVPGIGRLAARAHAAVNLASGTVTADASSYVEALDVAGVLSIAYVKAQATVRRFGGRNMSTSSVEVGDINLAGIRVVLTPRGLTLPGQTIPLPDTSPVLGPLRDAGVSMELLPEQRLVGGVRSGGVRITVERVTPDGGRIRTVDTFGEVIALVSSTAATPAAGSPPPAPAAGVAPSRQPARVALSGSAFPAAAVPRARPPAAGPIRAGQPAVDGRTTPTARPIMAVLPVGHLDTLSFYLMLVLAAFTAFAAQLLLRRSGVRPIWTF